ncbi:ribosome maturation factor RimM [Sporomusa sp. KB1]|jgi:16S rRNA processing protein RimM|uniref:ribosome maturation factor RimM n=1 Tax=Sporomusa sp. KB1 TaxID=943346 RepID=UPI0011AC4257|nr:ribosome maturation factor RimM [Sporomusa sp. KB1]TWH48441.1 16S rRNA processing protein RimM [Sporomusa sp. KB1]
MAKSLLFVANMPKTELITIGKIVAPHGVRGDVRIVPLTDFPDRFYDLTKVLVDDVGELALESARQHKKFILLKFAKLDSINDIEHLRGKLIKIRREDAVKLPEGRYYIFDIIGLNVFTEEGLLLGTITDVLQPGSNDVYVVKQQDKSELLIPAIKEVVKKIDILGKQMIVKLQEEMD